MQLYAVTTSQPAIRELARAMHDPTGKPPPLIGVFPDYGAPILREAATGREMVIACSGMLSPVFALKGKKIDDGVKHSERRRPALAALAQPREPLPDCVHQLLRKRAVAGRFSPAHLVRAE